jgi:hypothetical protein
MGYITVDYSATIYVDHHIYLTMVWLLLKYVVHRVVTEPTTGEAALKTVLCVCTHISQVIKLVQQDAYIFP